MNIAVNPHDACFKSIIKSSIVAKDFFQQHMPDDVKALIDFSTFKLASELLTDDELNENVIDVIYEAQCGQSKAYFNWVIEHKSFKQDLCFWALQTKVKVMARHREIHHTERFPLVFVVIVYHDRKPYPFSTHLRDYIDAPADIVDQSIQSSFQLVDLNLITDEQLRKHYYAGILQYFQKHIRKPDFMPYLEQVMPWLRDLSQESEILKRLLVQKLLYYSIHAAQIQDPQAFQTLIHNELPIIGEEDMQTLAEHWKQEGKDIGFQEGTERTREQIAKQLLAQGNLSFNDIAKATNLLPSAIRELAEASETVS